MQFKQIKSLCSLWLPVFTLIQNQFFQNPEQIDNMDNMDTIILIGRTERGQALGFRN